MELPKGRKAVGSKSQTASNPCLFVASEGDLFIIAVYVDDILLADKEDKQMLEVKQALSKRFQLKDMSELNDFFRSKSCTRSAY